MRNLFLLMILFFFFAACENSVTLKGNDDSVLPDRNEQSDEEEQDEVADEAADDDEAQDIGPDETETKDETVDTDIIWDNCSETHECEIEEMCIKSIGDCYGWGHCEAIPETCDDVYEPVCGCDDVTYSNICEAQKLLRNVKHSGECE